MNILFLSTWYPEPPDNGSKLRSYYLLRSLGDHHDVTLLSFAFATARPDTLGDMGNWCTQIQAIPIDPFAANQVGALRTFLSSRPVHSRPVPAMSQLVSVVLRSQPYDAVIASTGMMIDYALSARQQTLKVLEEHNATTRLAWERYREGIGVTQRVRRWLSWYKNRWYEARTYPEFDLITMVSDADLQATLAAQDTLPTRVEVVPNGVDCTHNRMGLAESHLYRLIFNGSLTYSANYDAVQWFIGHIWPQIRTQIPNAMLTITGSTDGVNLTGLALDDHVNLTGYVEDVRIPVAEAAVAIAPIRQGGGTRLKILEAMALGTPVVATSKGAEGLDVVDGEHLLLADTPDAFANAVVRLLRDVNLSHQLSVNARRLVEERYDWESIGQQFVSLVEETVERKRATK